MRKETYKYNDVFKVVKEDISARIPIKLHGNSIGPGIKLEGHVKESVLKLSSIAGYIENGILVITSN